jgi:hypothetical protein
VLVPAPGETLDLALTEGPSSCIWLSAVSPLGVVHGVPRTDGDGASMAGLVELGQGFRARVAAGVPDPAFARQAGQRLRQLIFGVSDILSLFHRARGVAAHNGSPLLVRILAASRGLAATPWELLLDPDAPDERFLTLSPSTHVVRLARVRTYPLRPTAVAPPLRMLLVLSSPPLGADKVDRHFDLYEAKRALLHELAPLIKEGLLAVTVEDRPTVDALRARIAGQEGGFHLLHYLGHAQAAALLLEREDKYADPVDAERFSHLLATSPALRLCMFSGCETAVAPPTEAPWPAGLSVADQCLRDACQTVVGMQALLPFRAERILSRYVYQALANGRPVGEALALARGAVYEDRHAGNGRLDWAVPCLFVGGDVGVPMIARSQAPRPPPDPVRRVQLKLDLEESDREFFARYAQLREVIDFVRGRTRYRVLLIGGPSGVGKTRLIDRALEDVRDDLQLTFYVLFRRLKKENRLLDMCARIEELLRQQGQEVPGSSANERDRWDAIIERLILVPAVIVLDDFDQATAGAPVLEAIGSLVQRRGQARVIVACQRPEVHRELFSEHLLTLTLVDAEWKEVWRWIRQNIPGLLQRAGETTLQEHFGTLGARLELWEKLAEQVAARPEESLSALVSEIAQAAKRFTPPHTPSRPGLRVAVAGPHLAGAKEFASAVNSFAHHHQVAGWAAEAGEDGSAALATIIPIPSPFDENHSTAHDPELVSWLDRVAAKKPNIALLDYEGNLENQAHHDRLKKLKSDGALLVASAANHNQAVYPAWWPETLAVGTAFEHQGQRRQSRYDQRLHKADLFAPSSVERTLLAGAVKDRGVGASLACYHVVAAAALVWMTLRDATADEVRAILVDSARVSNELGTLELVPVLDVEAALAEARWRLVRRVLDAGGDVAAEALLAAVGMSNSVGEKLLDGWEEGKLLVRTRTPSGDLISLRPES